jgi:hypothetical protein
MASALLFFFPSGSGQMLSKYLGLHPNVVQFGKAENTVDDMLGCEGTFESTW